MKGSVELLTTAMRTINFEAMFVNYVQFSINFHSFLDLDFHLIQTWSIYQSRKYCLIDKKPFLQFWNQQLFLSDSVT